MKKLLTLLAVILTLSISTQAQVNSLTINNNAGCAVELIFYAGSGATCGAATPTATTTTVNGSSTINIPNPQAVGFPAGVTLFHLVQVQANSNCGTNAMSVYECTGGSQYSDATTLPVPPPSPTVCTCSPATYVSWSTSGTNATININ